MSPLFSKMFVLVGAGGAGRALAFGAKVRGARVVVFDIDYGMQVKKCVRSLKCHVHKT